MFEALDMRDTSKTIAEFCERLCAVRKSMCVPQYSWYSYAHDIPDPKVGGATTLLASKATNIGAGVAGLTLL